VTATIGKYQVIDKIGEGAMGVVYRAMDPILNRHVAIKIMSEGLAQDEVLRERFLREAQAAGSLQHPNLVTIYDFGEIDGHLFIAMEFIQGVDLEQLLKHGPPLPLSAKLDIVIDVLNGLSYAHRRGVIHRDIKPANVRVDEDGHARIMDFGVAHLGTSNLTTTGVMVGTPNYMAPEQISGDPITPAVDLFSVGAMLYELLTNAKPFEGDTLHNVLFKIVSDTPPDVSSINPECPPQLTEIVKKALAKTPQTRWKSAAEFANALMSVRAKLGAPRLSKTVSQRVSIDSGLRKQQPPAGPGRTIALVGGGALAAVVLVAVGFVVARALLQSPPKQVSSTGDAVVKQQTPPATPPASDPASQLRPAADSSKVAATKSAPAGATQSPAPTPPRTNTVAQRPTPTRTSEGTPPSTTKSGSSSASPAAASPGPAAPTLQSTQTSTTAVSAPPPVNPAPAPVVSAPAPTTTVAVPQPENPREGVTIAVAAYARAIASRDVGEVRRAYPGITAAQEANWKAFFSAVRSISADLDITSVDVNGTSAVARLAGAYNYVTSAGRNEHQPITVRATLQKESGSWKIQRIE